MADADVQGMLIRIEATTAQLRQEIARGEAAVAQSAGKMDSSLGRIDTAFDRAGASAQSAGGLIKGALAAAIGAASIATVIKTADSYSQMSDRIGQATKSFGEYNTVQERLLATANRTYRPLEEAQELYIRTSDSLRSMGLSAGQSMDVMDSFSYLLVTNSASADKASSAIDAYSKSLQTGKVDADSWQAILAAMPTIVATLAEATGRSAEELKSLGAQGQLSLEVLTDGLQKSAAANGLLADSMGVAVRDALVALNNAFTVYVGQLNESTDGTGVLASGIAVLADNFGTLAEVAGVAAAGALAVYARGMAVSVAGSVLATKASIEDALARRAQATAILIAAQAEQQKAQTVVFLAEKEAVAAKGTAVQTQLSLQLAEARLAETRATNAVAAAQAGIVGTGRTLLGLLGGPVGIAMLAVGAATAFLTLRDNTSTLEKKLGDLADPMEKLIDRFDKLNRATQSVTLRELRTEIDSTKEKLGQVSGGIADKFESDLRNMGAAGADGFMAGLVSLPDDAQHALDLVRQASKDSASGISVDWKSVADQLRAIPGVTEQMAQAVEQGQITVSDLSDTLAKQTQVFDQLSGATNTNTNAQLQNNAAKAAADAAGQKYLDQLDKQYAALKDKTAAEAAERQITDQKIDSEGELAQQIRARAKAIDEQKEADKAATAETQRGTSAAKEAATEAKNQAKALSDLKAQADIAISSANGLAAAYLLGTDKSREFALQQKVEEALLKSGAGTRAAVTKAINDQQDAQDKLAVSKAAYDLGKETADVIAQAKATLMGADALAAYNTQKALTVALAGKNIEVGSEEYRQLLAANEAQQQAVRLALQAGASGGIMDRLYPQSKLLKDYTEDQNALNAAMELYPERAGEYRAALQRLGVEYEQNQNAATTWGKFTEGAVDRIDEAFANMWESVLSKSGNFMDTLKNSFKQFLAEMLHMAITKPIIVQIGSALGVGGLAASDSGGGLLSSLGGNGGITGLLGSVKNVITVAGRNFGQAITSGWSSNGIEGAFSNGADYVKSAITSAFTTGSAAAASTATLTSESIAASISQSTATYASQFSAAAGNVSFEGAASASASAASSGLATLSSVLGYIQGVYTIFQSFQSYGLKGAAVTGGLAAAGAYIGSFVGPIGTAVGFAIGATLGALGAGKLFSSGEKYPDQSTSATGRYVNGQYTDTGIQQGWQTKAPKYGAAADAQMSSVVQQFSTTLGMLYDTIGNGADVVAYNLLQVRKTSGKYSTTLGSRLDDRSVLEEHQQFNADDVAAALTENYDNVMGTFLAKAIVSSKSLPEYFKAQFTAFASDWDTTADEVIKAIEGVFTRFNGVNAALSQINVANLKLDQTGMIASDAILNIVASLADLDVETATAKDKVDALNTLVNGYYSAFFTADEQFADLTNNLKSSFGGLGFALPDTRTAYRSMVEDIDVTTAAGQAMFATMMGLATAADSYYTEVDKRAQAVAEAASEAAQAASEAAQAAANAAASAWSNYYGLFATDTDKATDTLARVGREFGALGVVLPSSRAGFVGMVAAIDQTTEAGKSLFNSLLSLATDADAAFDVMEASAAAATQAATEAAAAVTAALKLAVNNSFSAVQRAINAQQKAVEDAYNATTASLNDMASTAANNVSGLSSVGSSLSAALKSLRGDSGKAVQMLRTQAQATLQNALATARAGGSLANFGGLDDALDVVGNNTTSLYSSLEDFNRDQGRTAGVIADLEAVNGKQLTAAQALQKSLEDQIDRAKAAFDLQNAQFDAQLAFAQSQLDALNGVDTSVLSVAAAIQQMNSAVIAALSAMPGTGTGSAVANTWENSAALVHTAYKTAFGRDADEGGLRFWTDALSDGTLTYDQLLTELIKAGRKNGESIKIPGYASGGDFAGGLRLVGENGPELEVTGPSRIYNANQTAGMLNGVGSNAGLTAEIRALGARLDMIQAETKAGALNGGKIVKLLDRVTDGGNAMLTKELA
jgi:tape measure domain-containing protein